MLRSLVACGAIAVVVPALTWGLEAADARQIVERSAAAQGGIELLAKYPAGRIKVKGHYLVKGQKVDYAGESVYQLPDRIRSSVRLTVQGSPRNVVQILNGEKAALLVEQLPQHINDAQLQELRLSAYCQNVARLAPLVKEPKYALTALGEKQIDGKPAVGVRVSSTGQPDIHLYFDSATQLLIMLERPAFDASGAKVQQQEHYSEYRTAAGIKYPAKLRVVQNGKPTFDSEVLEFVPLAKVDPKEFEIAQ